MENIILIGMPGCGKTAIGKQIAIHLTMGFVDTDEMVVKKCGKAIKEIFSEHSEAYFREKESKVLKEACERQNTVIATGGGIILSKENRALMKKSGTVFYINRPLDLILRDIEIANRPLLANGKEKLIEIFNTREHLYQGTAKFTVLNDGDFLLTMKKILSKI